jgi:deoxyribose-phosphate aldolase
LSQPAPDLAAAARRALAALDLTSLGEDDTPAKIEALCAQRRAPAARRPLSASIPSTSARRGARSTPCGLLDVRVATVANFPEGGDDAEPREPRDAPCRGGRRRRS